MRFSRILFLGCFFYASALYADTTATPPATVAEAPAASLPPQNEFFGIDYAGYIDGSYNYLVRSNHFTSGQFDRVYDLNQNGLTLQQAALTISKLPTQGPGFLANAILGRDANGVAPLGINPQSFADSQNLGFTPVQAFVQYAVGHFTLMAGQFLTLVGEEQVNPTQDSNYSRSILFYATPDTHLGFRGVFTPNDKMTFTAGVNDGWNNITDFSRHKTVELGASFTLNPVVAFSLQGYSGQERAIKGATNGATGQRTLIDFVSTITATTKLSFAANYDYGWQTEALLPSGSLARAHWQGLAGYVNYKFNDLWQSSFRSEIFEDSTGFITGVRQNWREITLSVGYTPIKNLEIRAETRHDFSNANSFVDTNGITTNTNNQSFALEAFYQI
jgi:hypothetical protein